MIQASFRSRRPSYRHARSRRLARRQRLLPSRGPAVSPSRDRTYTAAAILASLLVTFFYLAARSESAQAFNYPDGWQCALYSGTWCFQDEPWHAWGFGEAYNPNGSSYPYKYLCLQGIYTDGSYAGGNCVSNQWYWSWSVGNYSRSVAVEIGMNTYNGGSFYLNGQTQ